MTIGGTLQQQQEERDDQPGESPCRGQSQSPRPASHESDASPVSQSVPATHPALDCRKESSSSTGTACSAGSSRAVSDASLGSVASLDTDGELSYSARYGSISEQLEETEDADLLFLGREQQRQRGAGVACVAETSDERHQPCAVADPTVKTACAAASAEAQRRKRPSLTRSETIDMGDLRGVRQRRESLESVHHRDAAENDDDDDDDDDNAPCMQQRMTAEQVRKKRMITKRSIHIPELLLPGTAQLRKQGLSLPKALQLSSSLSRSSQDLSGSFLSPTAVGSPLSMSISADSLRRFQPSGALSAPSSPVLHRHSHTGVTGLMAGGGKDGDPIAGNGDSDSDSTDGGATSDPYRVSGSCRRGNSFKFPLRLSSPEQLIMTSSPQPTPSSPSLAGRRSFAAAMQRPASVDLSGTSPPVVTLSSPRTRRSLTRTGRRSSPPGATAGNDEAPKQSPSGRRLLKIFQKS